jgi:hypothetical protein
MPGIERCRLCRSSIRRLVAGGETFSQMGVPFPGIATRYFGIVQWLYVIPVWRYLRKAEYKQTGKGWLIAASVTVLVNGTCMGFLPM